MPSDSTHPPMRSEDPPFEGEPPERLAVEIVIEDDGWTAVADLEAAVLAAARAVAGLDVVAEALPASACVALTGDNAVRLLNATYRGKDKPTNVLSFPSPDAGVLEAEEADFLGDVILARETVMREAGELGVAASHHLQHLVVHGLLHLLGYDHENDDDAEVMEALETTALSSIGVADPYAELE